jgi:DNA-directed RNA polymerase subunit RPC12/RpoP
MAEQKYYCGNCGVALYYGQKFREHEPAASCAACGTKNPVYFQYCYRCGRPIERDEPAPSIG